MGDGSYHQFCPVAMASEVLGTRWTLVLLREMIAGSSRFNDIRRGVPRMSPALLSKRLKELEEWGVVERVPVPNEPDIREYRLTASGRELTPIIEAIGAWGHRWTETKPQLDKLDAGLLMWDMRRNLNVAQLPPKRTVVQFIYPERRAGERNWWIMVDPADGADLCAVDPGFDVDLFVKTDLRTMTSIYMGTDTFSKAIDAGRMTLIGDAVLQRSLKDWLGLGMFSGVQKQVP